MRLVRKAIDALFFAGLSKEEFQQVREPVAEANRQYIVTWSVSVSVFWVMSLLMSLNAEAYARCRTVYAAGLCACLFTLTCALTFVRRIPWTLFPVMYLLKLSIFEAGVGIAVCQPDVRTATMIAIVILMPSIFLDCTITSIILHIATLGVYRLAAKGVIEPDIYAWGWTNLIIFSAVGILTGHMINRSRFERYVYADSVRKLAEMRRKYAYFDQMTGLKNRRAYAEKLRRLSEDTPSCFCVVMADVNGLKQVNDSYGHEAGDELILGASKCLLQAFEQNGVVYRIGGDEFCVIMPGGKEQALLCLERLEKVASRWNGRHIRELSISCGVASSQDCGDVEEVVREADRRMYEYKRDYYASKQTRPVRAES